MIDGQAYLIQEPFGEAVTLVWRDGQTETFQFQAPRMFLTATPDGWLMTNLIGNQLERYIWNGNSFEHYTFVNDKPMKLLSTVELGESPTD